MATSGDFYLAIDSAPSRAMPHVGPSYHGDADNPGAASSDRTERL